MDALVVFDRDEIADWVPGRPYLSGMFILKAHLACKHDAHVCAGHPSSVDALVSFAENTMLAGSQHGLI